MRRRGKTRKPIWKAEGNTSAYAEKRSAARSARTPTWKYLRVCGEEQRQAGGRHRSPEIPPRMRRRDNDLAFRFAIPGNTSAYAEKRTASRSFVAGFVKYLRVCGEERATLARLTHVSEIPPRMRRREFPTCGFYEEVSSSPRVSADKVTGSNRPSKS